MSDSVAGWYPDPSGDKSRLRYWDGEKWTDRFQPANTQEPTDGEPANDNPADAQPAQGDAPVDGQADEGTAIVSLADAPSSSGAQGTAGARPDGGEAAAEGEPVQGEWQDAPRGSAAEKGSEYLKKDETLRLVAFVFGVLSCVGYAVLIVPLLWMIPMTVYCWRIYKFERPNTVSFGVCSLIFLNLVSGILLLCSVKDE